MFVMWQYNLATIPASQHLTGAAQLSALLRVLHQRAAGDEYPHAVLLSTTDPVQRQDHGLHLGSATNGSGPQPQLTLVVGVEETPILWCDNLPAARQISVGPRAVTQPEPQDFFKFYSAGQPNYAPESSLISRDHAWQAARMFMTSGGNRPATITWRSRLLL